MIAKIAILFFILAVIATVLWCVIPMLLNKHKIKYNKQHPYRIVETGIGEYKLQKFTLVKCGSCGDIYEWNDIESSADLSDIIQTYNKLYDKWLKDQKEQKEKEEFNKLSKKVVKVIKQ